MEPKPDNNYGRDGFSWASNLGFWFRAPIVNGKYQNWECVNFFDDESANALLLDSMPCVQIIYMPSSKDWDVWCDWMEKVSVQSDATHPNRKAAVVLASCKWLGIEVKEIEE
jgi:hypothetical protein